jgi:hypothetical protein
MIVSSGIKNLPQFPTKNHIQCSVLAPILYLAVFE